MRDNPKSTCDSCRRRGPEVEWVVRHGVGLWLCGLKVCRSRMGRHKARVRLAWAKKPVQLELGAP
jgi:hypothetical protein